MPVPRFVTETASGSPRERLSARRSAVVVVFVATRLAAIASQESRKSFGVDDASTVPSTRFSKSIRACVSGTAVEFATLSQLT